MINILICDDDKNITNKVFELISEFEDKNKMNFNVDIKNSARDILESKSSYDIAVVDIEMPEISGLVLSQGLKEFNPDVLIIVLTSYSDYLDSAMKIQVFRYLSKPIDRNRFIKNFSEAIQYYKEQSKQIVIESSGGVYSIPTKDILYIENKKHGSLIRTKSREYPTNKKPQEWYVEINQPNCFIYSHKSYIVNLQNVVNFNKSSVSFYGNLEAPCISQRRYTEFKKAFFNFAGDIK